MSRNPFANPPAEDPPAPQPAPTPPAPQPQPPQPSAGLPPPPPRPPAPPPDDGEEGEEGDPAANATVAALRRERNRRRELSGRVSDLERERDHYRTIAGQTTGQLEALRRQVVEQAVAAAATGRLNDTADAQRFIDLSDVTVGGDGRVDLEKIRSRVEELVRTKPYLAASATNGHQERPPRPPALPGGGNRPAGPGGNAFNDAIRRALRG